MNHIMLDLETMGTGPNAAIVAIGAVEFELTKAGGQLGDSFYQCISLESAMSSGGQVDGSTVLWWLTQSDAARAMFAQPAIDHGNALAGFSKWMAQRGEPKNLRVWGNGASFDNVILASAYRRAELQLPWNSFNDRCYRTVKSMHPAAPTIQRTGTHHNAKDDAINQANHLIAMLTPATA